MYLFAKSMARLCALSPLQDAADQPETSISGMRAVRAFYRRPGATWVGRQLGGTEVVPIWTRPLMDGQVARGPTGCPASHNLYKVVPRCPRNGVLIGQAGER